MKKVEAPWTGEQVTRLNAFQRAGKMHPFTCPHRSDGYHVKVPGEDLGQLVATTDGFECQECGYTQLWAHSFMMDGTWE